MEPTATNEENKDNTTATNLPPLPGAEGVTPTEAKPVAQTDPGTLPPLPTPTEAQLQTQTMQRAEDTKFKVVLVLITIGLVAAGLATFLLLTDQGRQILGLDKGGAATTQQPQTQTDQTGTSQGDAGNTQELRSINTDIDSIEILLDDINPEEDFADFDEQLEFAL